MVIIKQILNSFLFWGGWIIIPFIMEIVPALGSVFLLIRRNLRHKKKRKEMKIYPEISLIIPVYNSADTLYGCIKSVNDSTYPNDKIRIFLVNNKGQDNSFAVYADCQKKFPDLLMQWLNAEQGKSRALNLALYNSDGKYIINLDSDGILEKNGVRAEFTMLYPTGDSVRQALAEDTANQLKKIGIKVTTEGVGWDTAYDRAQSTPLMWGWGAHTPMEFYNIYHTAQNSSFAEYSPYSNEKVDEYMDQALASPSLEE